MVTQGARYACETVWANDVSPRKAACYVANHGDGHFHLGSIEDVKGTEIPSAEIVWASFPCQDLSLAGKMGGLAASRSGLFWQWLRVLDEMLSPPTVIALENVLGLLSANGGEDFRLLYTALRERGYKVGPMLMDARLWVPQSRPRVFVVAVRSDLDSSEFEDTAPNWLHPDPVTKAMTGLEGLVFWSMPRPQTAPATLADIVDWQAPCFDEPKTEALLSIVASRHRDLLQAHPSNRRGVFPGYRRTRSGKQVLELRFDNISGCLRTAEGGSSRQFLVMREGRRWRARLITAREAARLMGAPDSYRLPVAYNEAYNAMGDAVVVPVVKHLIDHLLVPLSGLVHVRNSFSAASGLRLIA